MTARSDKLKRLEADLRDLEQWLKLSHVPKRDIPKHEAEIESIKQKIEEEKERLRQLKESGEVEEYVTPRKQPARAQYTEMPSLPEIDITEETGVAPEIGESEGDSFLESTYTEERTEEESQEEEYPEEEDPFSDRNRWKRGMLHSDEDEW